MKKSFQLSLALLVPTVLLVAPVRAGDDPDKRPEAVFKDFAAAMKKDNVKAVMSHVTRDSGSYIVGTTWLWASLNKAFTKPFFGGKISTKDKEHIEAIDAVLNRHAVSDDAVQKMVWKDDKNPPTDEDRTRALVAVGESVKDKPTFVTETLKVLSARPLDTLAVVDGVNGIEEAMVKEVRIDGKQANGQATIPGSDGKQQTATIYFKLESETWKIDLIATSQNWPQPPPPPPVKRTAQMQPPATRCDCRPGLLRRLFSCLRNW